MGSRPADCGRDCNNNNFNRGDTMDFLNQRLREATTDRERLGLLFMAIIQAGPKPCQEHDWIPVGLTGRFRMCRDCGLTEPIKK